MELFVHGKALRRNRKLLAKMLLVMKLTAIFLLIFTLHLSARSFSQTVTISGQNLRLEKVFKLIHDQTGYEFIYDEEAVGKAPFVSLHEKRTSLAEVLEKCFRDMPFKYVILDKTIVISAKVRVMEPGSTAEPPAPPVTITGKITDKEGKPLAGASIKLKGTQTGTTTDDKGMFSLTIPDKGGILVISYIGYKAEEVAANKSGEIAVKLGLLDNKAEEIVVVGYGVQKKVNVTGSVATVDSKEIEDRPATNVTNALQGALPGVTIIQSQGGQPGYDAGSITVRGLGTLNNTNPLVVINGVIGDLNSVNPEDIQSISVLKDAASSAIYGSRAANGVLLITTKLGAAGAGRVRYDTYVGWQKTVRLPSYLPSWQAATLYNEALANEGKAARWTAQDIQLFKDGTDPNGHPNTDWLKLLFKGNGIQQNHYLEFSGGTEKTRYLLSFGYFDQNGVIKKTNAKRYTSNINVSSSVKSNLKINGSLLFAYNPVTQPVGPGGGNFISGTNAITSNAYRTANNIAYKYTDGYYAYVPAAPNPIAFLDNAGFDRPKTYTLQNNVGADWEPVKGLHFKPLIGFEDINVQESYFSPDMHFYDTATGNSTAYLGPNRARDFRSNYTAVTLQALLDYSRAFGKHNVYILGGYSQEYDNYNWSQVYRQNFLNNSLTQVNAAPQDGQQATGSGNELALRSYFGRITYNFDERYLLEANLRYDGTSRFAPSNRWGLFPSFSGGWHISREKFLNHVSWLSDLKIRGSWGKLGNQAAASLYPYIPTIATGQNYVFGGSNPTVVGGIAPTAGANPDVKWESTTMSDGGLDASFFNNKLSFSADWFVKTTNGILYPVQVGATYGLSAPTVNLASVQNKGWELSIGYHNKTRNGIQYGLNLNAAFVQNKVLSIPAPVIGGNSIMKEGLPINSFYGLIAEGIFQTQGDVTKHATQNLGGTTGPGDIMYKDLNGDGIIDGNDRAYLGSPFPKITFGLHATAAWKGVDVVLFLQGAADYKNYIIYGYLGQITDGPGKPTKELLDSWSPQNPHATYPRPLDNTQWVQNNPANNPSSFWIKSAAYMRVKNVQVGYSLPTGWVKQIGISRARVYYSGQNLLTFSSFYKWVDPEVPAAAGGGQYPQIITNSVGINVTF